MILLYILVGQCGSNLSFQVEAVLLIMGLFILLALGMPSAAFDAPRLRKLPSTFPLLFDAFSLLSGASLQ